MSSYSVIPNDNTVIIDGEVARVDLSYIPGNVRALHWDDETGTGEIEYYPKANRRLKALDVTVEPEPQLALTREFLTDLAARHAQARGEQAAPDAGAGSEP